MRFIRTLILVLFITAGLTACWDDKDKPPQQVAARPSDNSSATNTRSEIDELKRQLDLSNEKLRWAEQDYERARNSRDALRIDEKKLISTAFDLKSTELLAASVHAQVVNTDEGRETRVVTIIRKAVGETFGTLGHDMLVALMKGAMDNPSIADAIYVVVKPMLLESARTVMIFYGVSVVAPVIEKGYDAHIGLLAATEGHSCRWQLAADANDEQKTARCAKVFKTIKDHYGVVNINLIEVLGVLHRLHFADDSKDRKGFKNLLANLKDLVASAKK